ncbi:MAG: hypothetical protein AB8G99_20200 [Planctomycetaceae bacterium]
MKRLAINFRGDTINMSLPGTGVLTAMVYVADRTDREPASSDEVTLDLGGLDSRDGTHPKWGCFDLAAGESVTITVYDDRITDAPVERTGTPPKQDEESKRNYVRQMAAELGWSITEP